MPPGRTVRLVESVRRVCFRYPPKTFANSLYNHSIAELQGDTIVRRYRDMRVASLRFSWSVREKPGAHWKPFSRAATDRWGWVHVSECKADWNMSYSHNCRRKMPSRMPSC